MCKPAAIRTLPLRAAAASWIYWGVAARANRSAVPGCWGRVRSAVFVSEAADTSGVCAAGFEDGARTWLAPFAGAGAFDHRSGRCTVDARSLYENESGQDVCSGGLGDERLDAARALRSGSPDYQNCAKQPG